MFCELAKKDICKWPTLCPERIMTSKGVTIKLAAVTFYLFLHVRACVRERERERERGREREIAFFFILTTLFLPAKM